MKKKIIILLMLFTLCGCEKKEKECPEVEEKVYIKYDNKEILADDIINIYTKNSIETVIEKIKLDILLKEYKDDKERLKEAEDNVQDTIAQLRDYYGDELESAIKNNTGYATIEAYQEYMKGYYLEIDYLNEYIIENNDMGITDIEDIDESITHRYYYEALESLYNKHNLEFEDKTLNKLYKEYMKELKEYYLEAALKSNEE